MIIFNRSQFPSEKIPTLEECVIKCLELDLKIYFDVKDFSDKVKLSKGAQDWHFRKLCNVFNTYCNIFCNIKEGFEYLNLSCVKVCLGIKDGWT